MIKPTIQIVVAYSLNRIIGVNNKLPWHLPSDLINFRRLTEGAPVIMGRKTFESLPGALPKRKNIVISRNANYKAEGAEVFTSFALALHSCRAQGKVSVIGGAEIYNKALPFADVVYATEILTKVEGDTKFPYLEPFWQERSRLNNKENGLLFDYVVYNRY